MNDAQEWPTILATEKPTEIVPPAEPEPKTATWRVFKHADEWLPNGATVWHEHQPITGTGTYGYWPTAEDVGKLHGVGEYLLLGDGNAFDRVISVTVVSEVRYFEKPTDDDGEGS
jgi:hypothetical protein